MLLVEKVEPAGKEDPRLIPCPNSKETERTKLLPAKMEEAADR